MSAKQSAPFAGASVGVLGGGQLGRMLGLSGVALGLDFVFVDPSEEAPAASVGEVLRTDYADEAAFETLRRCQAVTFEFENVPVEVVRKLEQMVTVSPGSKALEVAQDRLREKQCFSSLGIPTPEFAAVDSLEDLQAALARFGGRAVLKTRRFGYDGKGQAVLCSPDDAARAFERLAAAPLILERFVDFERELSVLSVRRRSGEVRTYPLVENQHRRGILRKSLAPAPNVTAELAELAGSYVTRLLTALDYVGVLALELFQTGTDLIANEMAPRVHNSGHWTIEGACTSQFENHLRAVLDLPLGATEAPSPSAMLNLIGALPSATAVLEVPDAHLHLYGKAPRAGRKLGHVTVRAPNRDVLNERVARLEQIIAALGE